MENTYRNYQDDIAIKFDYEDEHDKCCNLEGILFSALSFICDYNLADEFIEMVNNHSGYYLGNNFEAINTETFEEWLGDRWYEGWKD